MKDLKAQRAGRLRMVNRSSRYSKQDKIEIKMSELKSYQQMIENMKAEEMKLRKRLDVVGDPNYSLGLRSNIVDIKEKIHGLEENERKMRNDKFLREKDIDRVMMAGQSDAMKETQKLARDHAVLMDQWQKLNKKIYQQENTREEADEKAKECAEKLETLEAKAEERGFDLEEIYNGNEHNNEIDRSATESVFNRKKEIIEKSIQVENEKYAHKLATLKKKYEDLLNEKND